MTADLDAIVTAVRPYTMVCDEGVKFAAQCAIDVVERGISGAIVECGVWKGGCSMAMMHAQREEFHRDWMRKPVYMFDSFEGMPSPGPKDGDAAVLWQADTESPAYFDNCRANRSKLITALSLFEFREKEAWRIVEGAFEETTPKWGPREIALLRLDGDWYDATKCCLDNLGPRLSPGAIVIVDDYFAWEGCKLAVDEWLSTRPAIELQAMPDQSAAYFRMPS